MSEDLVSVVIPTYNYGRYVEEAVRSVLAQTYPDYEVIVVDDGSTDDTRERLAPYAGRIRYIHQENRGLSAARNTGIRAARGGLIAFLDSDDTWHPEKLAVQALHLARHPGLGLLASNHINRDDGEPWPVEWPAFDATRPIAARAIAFEDLVVGSRFGSCGVVARRRCFDEVGLFDESLGSAEDLDMWIRIARRFPVARLEVPLWVYRQHGASMQRATARMEANALKVIDKVFGGPDAMSRSPRLRRQALSNVALSMAFGYRDSQAYRAALSRIIRSLVIWPFSYPYEGMRPCRPLARLRLLAFVTSQAVSWYVRPGRSGNPGAGARDGDEVRPFP